MTTFEEREAAARAVVREWQEARPAETAALVEQVKAHAKANYEAGGWDVVVECWTDEQIAEALLTYDYSTGRPEVVTTFEAAIRDSILAQVVGVWADRQADARNSRF